MVRSPFRRKRERPRSETTRADPAEVISAAARTNAFTTLAGSTIDPGLTRDPGSTATTRTPDTATADQYSAWAERLRQKRVSAQRDIAGTAPDPAGPPREAHWSSQSVFTESQRVVDNDLGAHRDPVGISAAYAVLGLESDASLDEIDARYRRLAKQHHPDRFITSDAATQREHAERFRSINTARDVVRQSLGAI